MSSAGELAVYGGRRATQYQCSQSGQRAPLSTDTPIVTKPGRSLGPDLAVSPISHRHRAAVATGSEYCIARLATSFSRFSLDASDHRLYHGRELPLEVDPRPTRIAHIVLASLSVIDRRRRRRQPRGLESSASQQPLRLLTQAPLLEQLHLESALPVDHGLAHRLKSPGRLAGGSEWA